MSALPNTATLPGDAEFCVSHHTAPMVFYVVPFLFCSRHGDAYPHIKVVSDVIQMIECIPMGCCSGCALVPVDSNACAGAVTDKVHPRGYTTWRGCTFSLSACVEGIVCCCVTASGQNKYGTGDMVLQPMRACILWAELINNAQHTVLLYAPPPPCAAPICWCNALVASMLSMGLCMTTSLGWVKVLTMGVMTQSLLATTPCWDSNAHMLGCMPRRSVHVGCMNIYRVTTNPRPHARSPKRNNSDPPCCTKACNAAASPVLISLDGHPNTSNCEWDRGGP